MAELELEFDRDERRIRGLQLYLDLVTAAIGLIGRSHTIDHHPPMNAYVAISTRAAYLPDYDMALLWDERGGWSVAAEPAAGGLITIAHLGGDVLATPTAIAEFLRSVLAGPAGTPLRRDRADVGDLHDRLDRLATSVHQAIW